MKRSMIAVVWLLLGSVCELLAAPTVGTTAATPTTIAAGNPTTVTVTSVITDPSLITTGINLLRLNANGSSTILGTLHDDGLSGDSTAGDKTFTVQVTLNESPGQVQLQVSAAFKGVLKRSLSNVMIITASAAAPSISASVSPAPNAAGWNNADVTVTFSCSDSVSGIAFCPEPVTVSTEGANQTISGTARNNAGVTATASVTVNLDKTPPSITASVTPAPNAAGWNKSDVTVNFSCADSVSGVVACPPSVAITTEGLSAVTPPAVLDRAGNSATANLTVRLDKTPPTLVVASPADGASVFFSPATFTGSAGDSGSGLAGMTCGGIPTTLLGSSFSCDLALSIGPNAPSLSATDIAGNVTTTTAHVTLVGKPVVTITAPTNLSFTNVTPTTVRGTVDDPAATVTVNGLPAFTSGGTFSVIVPLNEGNNTLTAVAQNAGGNQGTADAIVTLDTTPPHLTITTPSNNAMTTESSINVTGIVNDIVVGTVNNQEAQVTINGVAAQVANRTFSATVPLNLGQNTIQGVARDRVGNSVTTNISVTRVDSSQPPAPIIGDTLFTNSLAIVAGNQQSGVIGSELSQPLTVFVHDPANNPVANQTVVFKVTTGGGTVSAGGAGAASVAINTDSNGQASARLTLGRRAGAGSNTVVASNLFAVASVTFSASALNGAPAQIVIDSGDNQTGATGQPITFPLVAVVTDAGHNRVGGVPVTFAISEGDGSLNGASTQIITTDSDGRAQAVLTLGATPGNNLVSATFSGNASPISFSALGKLAGDPAKTTISGVVLDNSNNAIPNTTLRLYQTNQGNNNNLPTQIGQPVLTGADGRFLMQNVPVGYFKLMADGTTAANGSNTYPTLEYDIVTVAGVENTVGTPIYLPVLDNVNRLCVDETHGGTLTLPSSPGFSLTVQPGAATFPGGSRTGCVTVSPVNGDKVPMTPGFGQQPRYIVTIQPVGTMFNPPAAITLPNVDGLAPRAKTEMYSYDHDLSMFVAIGTATVSDDGSVIASDPGVGVLKAGWHCGGDPNANGHVADCGECSRCAGDHCIPDPTKTDPTSPASCNGTPPGLKLSFNGGADTVNVTVGSSCMGFCGVAGGKGKCLTQADTGFDIQKIKDALQTAFSKVFDNSNHCMEPGLRQTIQDKIKRLHGVIVACRPDVGTQQYCADAISVKSNNFELRPSSFNSSACGDLAATLFHEMIHGLGDEPGAPADSPNLSSYHNNISSSRPPDCRDRVYGCEESCFNSTGGSGNAFACTETPATLNQAIASGNGDAYLCSKCSNVTYADSNGMIHTSNVCPTINNP